MIKHRRIRNGCWICTNGCLDSDGYPRFCVEGKLLRAHRIVYARSHGNIGRGMEIRHTCDNPMCVNPEHLIVGTHADNMRDMRERGSLKGERNPQSLLKEHEVLDIKKREHPAQYYANRYAVSRRTIYGIWEDELWKHVA